VQSSIIGYFGFRFTKHAIKFCSVLFGSVVHASCDKQDSLMRGGLRGKWTSMVTAMYYCMVHIKCWSHFSYWSESQILVENHVFAYPTCIRRPH